jgi:alpha/beta superfamily hydrolase
MRLSDEITAGMKPAFWGAAAGAIALAIMGFTWGGWVTGGNAQKLAKNYAETAVVAALLPICIDKFRHAAAAPAKLAEMKQIGYSWEQAKFVENGGWATTAGSTEPNSAVAKACAEALTSQKAADLH